LATQGKARLSTLVVSEVRALRDALARALDGDDGIAICSTCSDACETLSALVRAEPDIVLLDAALPHGPQFVAELRRAGRDTRVVVFAVAETAENIIAWGEAGVAGYIPQTTALCDFGALLLGIAQDKQVCSHDVAAALLRRLFKMDSAETQGRLDCLQTSLTIRERQILELLGAGLSNKEIAHQLNVAVATAKSHVHNLLMKLKLKRRSQAAQWMRAHKPRMAAPLVAAPAQAAPPSVDCSLER
jgi:two-component system nitrate/nitrite response regulator NarL